MFIINIIKSYRDIIAICDKDLLGKKFEDDKFQLDIKENFYNGREVNEDELIAIMEDYSKEDATFNIVGENSIKAALKAKLIAKEGVKEIKGIKFALVLS